MCTVKDAAGNVVPQPKIKFAIDLNGTRVAAQHGLLLSALRLNRTVKVYAAQTPSPWALSDTQWAAAAEFEGVLSITKTMSTYAQSEAAFLGAYGAVLKAMTLARLRHNQLHVVDLLAIREDVARPERTAVDLSCLSSLRDAAGRTCLERAQLEAERRWCGNQTETIDGTTRPMMSEREKLAILLDLRTLRANGFNEDQMAEATLLLEEEYVKFAKQAQAYEREKEKMDLQARKQKEQRTDGRRSSSKAAAPLSGFEYDPDLYASTDDSDTGLAASFVDPTMALRTEFRAVFKAWKKIKVDWALEFPDHEFPDKDSGRPDLVRHLMQLPMGMLYKKIMANDPLRLLYGWLPRMALCSRGQIGTLLAESFCERILSQSNLVLVDGNTLLSDEELEMVVVLRMNRSFMKYMRTHYNHLSKQEFLATVVRL